MDGTQLALCLVTGLAGFGLGWIAHNVTQMFFGNRVTEKPQQGDLLTPRHHTSQPTPSPEPAPVLPTEPVIPETCLDSLIKEKDLLTDAQKKIADKNIVTPEETEEDDLLDLIDAGEPTVAPQPLTQDEVLTKFAYIEGMKLSDASREVKTHGYKLHPIYNNFGIKMALPVSKKNVIGVRISDSDFNYRVREPSPDATISELLDVGGTDRSNRGMLTKEQRASRGAPFLPTSIKKPSTIHPLLKESGLVIENSENETKKNMYAHW